MNSRDREARRRLDAQRHTERARQEACAFDFIWSAGGGESIEEEHAARCLFGRDNACSRSYDLYPESESDPYPSTLYEGSLIGALYEGHVDASIFEAGWRVVS